MTGAYYNENDPKVAAWLEWLIAKNQIAPGDVDTRSITDVKPGDLKGYTQCHFFAGIGGWSYALRLARWSDDRPVWTGSCPCQPFSNAGKRKGNDDARHLWPIWFNLIGECNPPVVFGEQVESAVGHGWLDGVFGNLEAKDYACGATVLGAHSVGAPHIRQRLWWVGQRLDNATGAQDDGGLGYAESNGRKQRRPEPSGRGAASGRGEGFWSDADWLPCTDGKSRRVEPGTFPLAHGIPGRVGLLRGYGNAIVPQVAAEFITTYREITE